jgi:periplasmic copper chaperone A
VGKMQPAHTNLPRVLRASHLFALWIALAIVGYAALAYAGVTSPITVDHPWFRFLLPTLPAGAYMTLHNSTSHTAVLTAARSDACGSMMLHKTVNQNGQAKMIGVKSIVIPAHGSFAFRPGAYRVMCMQPRMKPGQTVPVTLEFDNLAPLTVQFKVYGATGRPGSK